MKSFLLLLVIAVGILPRTQVQALIEVGPGDTLIIEDETRVHFGQVRIDSGVMILRNSRFTNVGNILLSGTGEFLADSSDFGFGLRYGWQFGFGATGNSVVRIENSTFILSLPVIMGFWGDSEFSLINTHSNAWKSGYFYDTADAYIEGCTGLTGEYCIIDSGTGNMTISNSDTVGVWLSFYNGSSADFTTLYEEFVEQWQFPDDVGAQGIPYTVQIDSSYIRNTSVMIYKGSAVTLRNSTTPVRIRATDMDSLVMVGLTDSTHSDSMVVPLSDRYLELINSMPLTYSIYAIDSSQVWLDSSRVSEIMCTKKSNLFMNRSIHTGKAGAFWVWDNSTALVESSDVQIETVIRWTSRLTMINSSISHNPTWGSELILEGFARVMLLNSTFDDGSDLSGWSVLYSAALDSPLVASHEDSVSVHGSAYVQTGDLSSVTLESYRLRFESPFYPDSMMNVGPAQTEPVDNGLLGYWNTLSLPEESYELSLLIIDSAGDSVETHRPVYVQGPAVITLTGSVVGPELQLIWSPVLATDQYWVYGAGNHAYFEPGLAPGYQHRLSVLPASETTWSDSSGIGMENENWTYVILAASLGQELGRSNRIGEHDFSVETQEDRGVGLEQ